MSSESSDIDNSSTDDIELKEFSRKSDGYSDSGSSVDFRDSSRGSIKQSKNDEDKINDVSISFLNTSDENHHEFDIKQASLSSLKGISPGYLNEIKKSSSDGQANGLTQKASFLEESSTRKFSSLNSLERLATEGFSSLNALEGTSTRRVASLDTPKESSTRRISSLNSSDGPAIGRVSSLNPLEGTSTGRVWSLNASGELSNRRVLSLDTLNEYSTRKVSSPNFLGGSSTRKVSSLDCLERPLKGRVTSAHPMERSLARKVSSLDPLECPSTRTEGSLPSNCRLHNSRAETNGNLNRDPPTEQNGCYRALAWLCSFSRQIILSKYYLLFNVALLAVACSAIYMGTKYDKRCNGCPKLPFLVKLLGILGSVIMIFRIGAIASIRYFSPPLDGREFNSGLTAIGLLSSLFVLIEMDTIFSCKPGFVPYRENFCIKVFYYYTYYVNVIVLFAIMLLILIHILGYFAPDEDE